MTANSGSDGGGLIVDCRIEAGAWPDHLALEALAEKTLLSASSNASLRAAKRYVDGSEVSLLFTDDATIKALNGQHRAKQTATNVLSFPQKGPDAECFGPYLGDIVFAEETISREAALENKPFMHHVQHLMVHGFLHLFGYDHIDDDDADEMEGLETTILQTLGLADPYGDTVKP
ncbi:MAG: rRNA maturation RNase YbeY [Pseudomonadota bacterium]